MKTIKLFVIGFLIFLVSLSVKNQTLQESNAFVHSQKAFEKGDWAEAIKISQTILKNEKVPASKLKNLEIITYSYISLGNFDEAEKTIQKAIHIVENSNVEFYQKASIYFCASWLNRQQRKVQKAFEFSKKGFSVNPDNSQIKGEYYLNIGRILFLKGYDISAIIWLEKAENELSQMKKLSPAILDVFRFLSHAWASKSNFHSALFYNEKLIKSVQNSKYRFKYRQALFDRGIFLSATGRKSRAYKNFKNGLNISLKDNDRYYSRSFLNSIILNSLYNYDTDRAKKYLPSLENLDKDNEFSFDILLIKAILFSYEGKSDKSDKIFKILEERKQASFFTLLFWKVILAEKNSDWMKLIKLNKELSELARKYNYREELPRTELLFAKAYYHLNQKEKAANHLEKAISLIEEIRKSPNKTLSLGIYETYHNAYRLLAQLKQKNLQESFELTDFLKARVLKDKISNSIFKEKIFIKDSTRKKLEKLTTEFIDNQSITTEIEIIEKTLTGYIPKLSLEKPNLDQLKNIDDINNSAIISYFFTLDRKLFVYLWEKDKPLKYINLNISESEIVNLANQTDKKIKNRVFFKRDGKILFEKLLKPLNIKAKHLIIIPDKTIWKIPFQALSPDGKKYLIEEKLISYSPSVSILLDQLQNPAPKRKTLQAFANSTFDNKSLKFVNSEAKIVSGLYNSKPVINASIHDFQKLSGRSDINHFAMHAQVNNEQPLDSYLAFKKAVNTSGRLTVGEILDMNLKKGSLAFLASCDTTNVLNGEGLVSLSWAMMGAGATTVISAQWEANDKSTQEFAKVFYENYKTGISSVEAYQKASVALIVNKSQNMHEPYFWAEFTLNGDFR